MELGNFSISLAVKDIGESKLFYEKLGFSVFMGDQSQHWLIMMSFYLLLVSALKTACVSGLEPPEE